MAGLFRRLYDWLLGLFWYVTILPFVYLLDSMRLRYLSVVISMNGDVRPMQIAVANS
jgi:hypothetical protein